jgi:hypothetical protein
MSHRTMQPARDKRWVDRPASEDATKRLVAAAPRLTPDQKARLRALLDVPEAGASE